MVLLAFAVPAALVGVAPPAVAQAPSPATVVLNATWPGPLAGTSPSTAWAPDGSALHVFATGSDHKLYQKYWTGTWSSWISFTGPAAGIASSPSITWTIDAGRLRLDVFVIGADGVLYQKSWVNAVWTDWTGLGGTLVGAPAASWSPDGSRVDVFATGNGAGGARVLYQKYWTNGTWSSWISFPNPGSGTPTAITDSPSITWYVDASRLDVFLVGANGVLYQKSWVGSIWTGWSVQSQSPALRKSPAAAWTSPRLDVFATSAASTPTQARLYQKYWTGTWSSWVNFAGPAAGIGSGPSIAWTPDESRLDVFVIDGAGAVAQKFWVGTWSGWVIFPAS